LSADHELDPTTYAVRAVANAGINPYRLLLAGLIASTGRRLAYGRSQAVSRLLDEVCASTAPRDVVIGRLKDGEAIPGFGSPLYPQGDPRATTLLAAIDRNLPSDVEVQRLHTAIGTVRELTGLEPDFGMVNLFLGRKFGLANQAGISLRLGRMAGWMAHAMEQYHEHDLVRPHAPYVGPLPDLTLSS
jgi:citrate synthase